MDQDSFDSYTAEEMLVMATENIHINHQADEDDNITVDDDELPKSLIVTNVSLMVFDDEVAKTEFEQLFQEVVPPLAFHYLRSFQRVRIDYTSNVAASMAKNSLDLTLVRDQPIHCYFIQVLSPCNSEDTFLHPPPMEKAFLISPPCSPPVGWVQPRESCPVPLDYELIAALAQLNPGENHELHPSKEVTIQGKCQRTPSIVVQVCEESGGGLGIPGMRIGRPPIQQTRCPDRPERQAD